jgi:pimeloyl-ACP methyl ester carboxylesterase
MAEVISRDGTRIAFEKAGEGPALILVDGALGYRAHWGQRPLAAALADRFAVYAYDRRGRGESGDTLPYAVEREIEDIEALIAEAGGSAYLYGVSSGAALALKAAAALGAATVPGLALYEPPYNSDDEESKQEFARYAQQMAELLGANLRGDAVAFFLADMLPAEALEGMRRSPDWPILEAVAPTLAYDNAVMGDGAMPAAAAGAATMPALVLGGSESPDFLREAVEALARAMPRASGRLSRATHMASPKYWLRNRDVLKLLSQPRHPPARRLTKGGGIRQASCEN